jgi:hypothetical protein
MSKSIARQRKTQKAPSHSQKPRKRKALIALCLFLTLIIAVGIMAMRRSSTGSPKPSPAAPVSLSPNSPSKEYIYAGGRLIATEEPGGISTSVTAPSGLTATGTSSPQITLTWTASTGSLSHYEVERKHQLTDQYTVVNPNVTASTFPDTAVSASTAYLYRVRAVDTAGNYSAYSNIDLATTVTFTNDPLVSASTSPSNATSIYASHLTELRTAIDAVRSLAGLVAANWKNDPAPQQSGQILLAHFTELRTNLNPALSALSFTPLPDDPTLAVNQPVKAAHVQDVRERVK